MTVWTRCFLYLHHHSLNWLELRRFQKNIGSVWSFRMSLEHLNEQNRTPLPSKTQSINASLQPLSDWCVFGIRPSSARERLQFQWGRRYQTSSLLHTETLRRKRRSMYRLLVFCFEWVWICFGYHYQSWVMYATAGEGSDLAWLPLWWLLGPGVCPLASCWRDSVKGEVTLHTSHLAIDPGHQITGSLQRGGRRNRCRAGNERDSLKTNVIRAQVKN